MIVVFGSLNIDIVMAADHLPRPGETVIGADYFLVPGGKGANQACAAARAAKGTETQVAMIGRVGRDDWGGLATELLAEAGVDIAGIGRGARLTGCASVLVDRAGENAIVVASGANMEASAAQVPDEMLAPGTWLVLQMEVDLAENWALITRARAQGARVLLNVAPAAAVPDAALAAVDVLVVNQIEATMLAEAGGFGPSDPIATARALRAAHGLVAIVTLGAAGAVACSDDGAFALDALAVDAVDTTGAGDAFVGILAAGLDRGDGIADAMRRASVGAGICCAVAGTQSSVPWAAEIDARLADLPLPSRID